MFFTSSDTRPAALTTGRHPVAIPGPAVILNQLEEIIVVTDLHFNVLTWNEKAATLFGKPAKAVSGIAFNELVQLQYLSCTGDAAYAILQSAGWWKGSVAYTNTSGTTYTFQYSVRYLLDDDGERNGAICVGSQIAEADDAETGGRSAEFYRSLVNNSLDGLLLMNEQGVVIFVAPSVQHILGFKPSEVLGHNAFNYVHPEDRATAAYSFINELEDHSEVKFIIGRLLKKDGSWLWCMIRAHNLMASAEVRGVAIYFHDDTPRRMANEALKQSKVRFRSLVQHMQTGVLVLDKDGCITMSNPVLNDMLGTSEEEMDGVNFFEYVRVLREDGSEYETHERPTYQTLMYQKLVQDEVIGIRRPGKEVLWLLVNAIPIMNEDGSPNQVICSFTDITERKKAEQQMMNEQMLHQRQLTQASIDSQEKERREIGKELHDNIGQQLTTIKLYLDLAKSTADDQTAEMVALAQRNVSDVINEIRNLCRSLIPSSLGDLGLIDSTNDLIYSIVRTQKLSITFRHDHFEEDHTPENQRLMLFRILQEQLNNIVKHAQASHVLITLSNENRLLQLDICDDGRGFDAAHIKKGVGLVNMANRAQMFGGTAVFETAPGMGCTLKVRVPLGNNE